MMSIRTYIFALLTSLVLIIAVILSYQSAYIFIKSVDFSIEDIMFQIGEEYPKGNNIEQVVLNYHVTTDWNKVPQPVREQFPVIPSAGELHSKFVDWAYITPPKKIYALLVLNRDGKQVFISDYNEHVHQDIAEDGEDLTIDPMIVIILVGLSGIGIFIVVLLYIFKKVAQPMESLQQWAKQLKLTELNHERPDFTFRELNDLATLIHHNLASVADAVEREQTFLNYASHELRTPIAVLRSNSALLEKVNPEPSTKERVIRDRIQRASLTMKSMTETLLWLSREGDLHMPIEQTRLGVLVDNTQAELAYLLTGKSVVVKLDTDDSVIELAVTPSIIVLNNLIRNAFQHTQQGHVDIVQHGNQITITNVETEFDHDQVMKGDLGFGLGMQLVEKLALQFGWYYAITNNESGYQVTVLFTTGTYTS